MNTLATTPTPRFTRLPDGPEPPDRLTALDASYASTGPIYTCEQLRQLAFGDLMGLVPGNVESKARAGRRRRSA